MDIGEKIKYIREKMKLTLKDLSRELEKAKPPCYIEPSSLSRYENGLRTPDNDFIKAFGTLFQVSGDWLLYDDPPIYKATRQEKDVNETFLTLTATLNTRKIKKNSLPSLVKIPLESLTEDTPENYLQLLEYMLKYPEIRADIFKFFHIFLKPRIDMDEKNPLD